MFAPSQIPIGYGAIDRQSELESLLANLRAIRGPQLARKEQQFQEDSFNAAKGSFDESVESYSDAIDTANTSLRDYRTQYQAYENAVNKYLSDYGKAANANAQNQANYRFALEDYNDRALAGYVGSVGVNEAWRLGLLIGIDPSSPRFGPQRSGNPTSNFTQWYNQNVVAFRPNLNAYPAAPVTVNYPVDNTGGLYPGPAPTLNIGQAPSFNYQPVTGKYGKAMEADEQQQRFASFQQNLANQKTDPYQAIRQELVRASQRR